MIRPTIRRLILYGVLPVLLGLAYHYTYELPQNGADYSFGYESDRWAIEVRWGRATLHTWEKIAESSVLWARRPPMTQAELDRWHDALPAANATGFFYVADKGANDPRTGLNYLMRPASRKSWTRTTVGSYAPGTEVDYCHTCYLVGFAYGLIALCAFAEGKRTWLRHMRVRRGLCLSCGYDLRTVTADRCPECGRPTGGLA